MDKILLCAFINLIIIEMVWCEIRRDDKVRLTLRYKIYTWTVKILRQTINKTVIIIIRWERKPDTHVSPKRFNSNLSTKVEMAFFSIVIQLSFTLTFNLVHFTVFLLHTSMNSIPPKIFNDFDPNFSIALTLPKGNGIGFKCFFCLM